MTGQEAVTVAEEFNKRIGLTGLILTKMDGDARGGAALSVTSVTGVPIKFIGVGEKADALVPYHPDRLASRILGMGDVQTFVEKAKLSMDEARAREMERKMRNATFTLEDFLEQMHQLREMGGLGQVLDMIPGFGRLKNRIGPGDLDDDKLNKTEAIILSMTPEERQNPSLIGGSRKRRICRGKRDPAPGREPASEPVPTDAKDDEGHVRHKVPPPRPADGPAVQVGQSGLRLVFRERAPSGGQCSGSASPRFRLGGRNDGNAKVSPRRTLSA